MSNILRTIDLASPIHKNYKLRILNEFIEKNKDLAPQGSPEWLAERQHSVGGSEMAVVAGVNPYQKADRLVAQKVGFSEFNGNIATRWGKLFEDNTTRICEILFDIDSKIKETGSLAGAIRTQRYSPDGLAVIKMICIEHDDEGNEMEVEQYCTVVFEFKSPYSGIPAGFIPHHYMPQVKTGMCSIPITDFALFINNMFRKCTFDELGTSVKYDTNFHSSDIKRNADQHAPLSFGMILFYQTKEQQKKFYKKYKESIDYVEKTEFDASSSDSDSDSSDGDFFNRRECKTTTNKYCEPSGNTQLYKYIYSHCSKDPKKRYDIRDFGKSYHRNFSDILELFDNKFLSVKYCDPHILDEYNNNPFLTAQAIDIGTDDCSETLNSYRAIIDSKTVQLDDGHRPLVGYLPWKLCKSDIIYEPRDPDYVKKHSAEINRLIGIVEEINSKKTDGAKAKIFKKHFPKSRILKECGLDNSEHMQFLPIVN
jgi:hypothetical protein